MSWDFGAALTGQPLNTWVASQTAVVVGADTTFGTGISISKSPTNLEVEYSVNSAAFTTTPPTVLFNGDGLRLKVKSSSSASTQVSVQVTGVTSDTFSVTTDAGAPVGNSASNEVPIYLPISPSIRLLADVAQFFGPLDQYHNPLPPVDLRDYLAGAGLVPSSSEIANNSAVPASGSIDLSDLKNAYNFFALDEMPPLLALVTIDAGASGTFSAENFWVIAGTKGTGIHEGNIFGSPPFHAFAEWRWTFVKSSEDIQGSVTFEVKVNGASLTENSGTWQSGWANHKNCSVKITTTTNADQEVYGQLTLEGRYIHNTSITVSNTVTCNLVIISEN